ncbi:MAG: hypothetical protein WBG54_23450 [Acidobacteriaceae bacterium]
MALLLEIIADELYVARTDREFEGATGSGPEMWEAEGRDYMIRGIEAMRERAEKLDVK